MPVQIPRSAICLLVFPLLYTGCSRKPAGSAPPVVAEWTLAGQGKCVAFSPDGRLVAVGIAATHLPRKEEWTGVVEVYDIASKKMIARLPQPRWVNSVAFSREGKYLACAIGIRQPNEGSEYTERQYQAIGGEVAAYDTDKYKEVFRYKSSIAPSECRGVAFHPKGTSLYAVTVPHHYKGAPPGEVRAWSVPGFKEEWTTDKSRTQFSDLVVSHDGKKLYVQDVEGARVLSSQTGETEAVLIAGKRDYRLTIAGNGQRLGVFSYHGSGDALVILELPDGKVLDAPHFAAEHAGHPFVTVAALDSTGKQVVVSGRPRSPNSDHVFHVSVWDVNSGAKYYWEVDETRFYGFAYSPDGTMIAGAASARLRAEGYLAVWKVPALK
jgi:WD40 repeat protein